jgi:threonine dehydratase
MAPDRPGVETRVETAPDRASIRRAESLIRPYIRRTPIIEIEPADFGLAGGHRLTIKLELLQHSGSFKVRGAFTNLLTRPAPGAGVVAASGGNHGAAVAFAARRLGIPAKIFVPSIASPAKLRQIREYGADLVVGGQSYAEALAASETWMIATGALPVHAFDQMETLLGQGTLGAELHQQAPDLDTVLVAVGGGGLIGGVASWYRSTVRVVGVEPDAAPTLTDAVAAGRPVDAKVGGLAADSLAPRRVGTLMFPIAQHHVNHTLLVTDDEIRAAQEALWRVLRVVAEPGGAAAFAALLSGRYQPRQHEHVGVLICGGNTTAVSFDR